MKPLHFRVMLNLVMLVILFSQASPATSALASSQLKPPANALDAAIPSIWGGPTVTFTKADNADWTQAANQDNLTANVWLTRANLGGLFNIAQETGYNSSSPADTEWAYGTLTNYASLMYQSWVNWNGRAPPSMVGKDAVLHVISENIYLSIKFTAWTSGGGGGFSYERSTPAAGPAVSIGPLSWDFGHENVDSTSAAKSFTLLSAGAADLVIGTLGIAGEFSLSNDLCSEQTVPPLGTCTFDVTFSPTSAGVKPGAVSIPSNAASSPESVSLSGKGINTSVSVWGGPTITFTKEDYADWTLTANQDHLTANVWLTSANSGGLFNIAQETGYSSSSPADTEWAYGTLANYASLTYRPWVNWNGYYPPSMVGKDAVLHLISENVYLSIKFTAWTSGGDGGGYSYERSTPAVGSAVSIGPLSWDFGHKNVDSTSAAKSFALLSAGAADLVIGTLGIAGEFSLSNDLCSGQTVPPLGTCTFDVTFSPTSAGVKPGAVSIPSNAAASPESVSLSGKGINTSVSVWGGPTITFTKEDYANWTLAANQDRLTASVWLTRANTRGLFNIAQETGYSSPSPADTEWAYGTLADYASLTYQQWVNWNDNNPASMVGKDAVLHLIPENIYLCIKFTSWTSGGDGGGFSYERSTPAVGPAVGIGPLSWDFGHENVDSTSAAKSFTLLSAGAADLVIGTLGIAGEFSLSNDLCSGQTIPPLGTCTFDVTFSPASAGVTSGAVSIPSNAASSPESVSLSGKGINTSVSVWGGPTITFTKEDDADWTQAANQDQLTASVWLTRADTKGLFNIAQETGYNSLSPADTEWAYGTLADYASLTYRSWVNWNGNNPPGMVGKDAVLHLIPENIYLSIQFTSWTPGGDGGGFSYERSTPAVGPVVSIGPLSWDFGHENVDSTSAAKSFTLLSAGAVDLVVGTLGITGEFSLSNDLCSGRTVPPAGTCTFDVTFSPTSAGVKPGAVSIPSNTAYSPESVSLSGEGVITSVWGGPTITFNKEDYADWTLAANQDHLTASVWLTRANTKGLFNIAQETGYNSLSPADTEWAYGTLADYASLTYQPWINGTAKIPPSCLGWTPYCT